MKTKQAAIAAAGLVIATVIGASVLNPKPSAIPERRLMVEGAAGVRTPLTVQPDVKQLDELRDALAELERRERKWRDAVALADVTARLQLAPVVKDLQEQARAYEDMSLPKCLEAAKPFLVESRNATVNGFMAFMNNAALGRLAFERDAEIATRADRNARMVIEGCRA